MREWFQMGDGYPDGVVARFPRQVRHKEPRFSDKKDKKMHLHVYCVVVDLGAEG